MKPDVTLDESAAKLRSTVRDVIRLLQWHDIEANAPAITEERVHESDTEPYRVQEGMHWTIKPRNLLALSWGRPLALDGQSDKSGLFVRITYLPECFAEATITAEQFATIEATWREWRSQWHSPSSANAEAQCKEWLQELMRASPDARTASKKELQAEAVQRFPGLANKAFERSWRTAIATSGAVAWSRPGRRAEN